MSAELGLKFLQTLANRTTLESAFGDTARGQKLLRLLEASVIKVRAPPATCCCTTPAHHYHATQAGETACAVALLR